MRKNKGKSVLAPTHSQYLLGIFLIIAQQSVIYFPKNSSVSPNLTLDPSPRISTSMDFSDYSYLAFALLLSDHISSKDFGDPASLHYEKYPVSCDPARIITKPR